VKHAALIASILVAFLGAALSGCGGRDRTSETVLTVRIGNASGGQSFELRCDPPGGSAPQPEQLCATLADHSEKLLFSGLNQVCIGGPTTPHIYVSGHYRGRTVRDRDLCGHAEAASWLGILPNPPAH
jgi:hypothetical protein